jgi:hypothetical protein
MTRDKFDELVNTIKRYPGSVAADKAEQRIWEELDKA